MGKPTGAGGKQFGQFVTFHLFESFPMNITLKSRVTFKVHSSRVSGVKMAGSKALSMMEKTDLKNQIRLCRVGQNVYSGMNWHFDEVDEVQWARNLFIKS